MVINMDALTLMNVKIAMEAVNRSVIILRDHTTALVAVDLFQKKLTEKNVKKSKIIITILI